MVFLCVNYKLHYQFNMNVDQSTRAIPVICTCENVIWIFLENESILDRIGGYIFCKCQRSSH